MDVHTGENGESGSRFAVIKNKIITPASRVSPRHAHTARKAHVGGHGGQRASLGRWYTCSFTCLDTHHQSLLPTETLQAMEAVQQQYMSATTMHDRTYKELSLSSSKSIIADRDRSGNGLAPNVAGGAKLGCGKNVGGLIAARWMQTTHQLVSRCRSG